MNSMEFLKEFQNLEMEKFIQTEKPDWQDLDSSIGIEITRNSVGTKYVLLNAYKNNTDKFPNWYIGLVGFLASYNGRFFDGGYAKPTPNSKGIMRNYYDEAKRNYIEHIKAEF